MNYMTVEDELFIDYCRNGNQRSFEELFNRVKPWLSKMLYRIVADTDVTYDLQQETWIKLINTCHKFNPEKGKINNFIFTIAKNEALKWKFNYHKADRLSKMDGQKQETVFGINELTPDRISELNEKCRGIRDAIAKLDKDYQDVILMFYYADFEVKEIAKLLNKPDGTIKTWLDRGRKALEKALPKYIKMELQ